MIKQLITLSLAVTIIFAAVGSDVQCNTNDQSSCGLSGGSTWTAGTGNGRSKISECNDIDGSLTNVYDTIYSSCPVSSKIYANSAKNGCQTTPAIPGAVVLCQKSCTCTTCCTISPAFVWSVPNGDTNNCIIISCLAASFLLVIQLIIFANYVMWWCQRNLCQFQQYILCCKFNYMLDRAQVPLVRHFHIVIFVIQALPLQHYYMLKQIHQPINPLQVFKIIMSVPCQNSGFCTNCGSFTNFAFIPSQADAQNRYVKSCLAASVLASGLNDYFCGSCNFTNKFSNAYGNACVNSTKVALQILVGLTQIVQICNVSGANSANQYAAADSKSCISTKPIKQSSSVIVFSGLIVASLLI
ncbi:cell surface immobilization antigen (macronuclear) [Tetrahymena thermophila SB210]|uniref:Cell surface immobilization antigen n=1 Tax=Tetrahymena thermophila (strain SB210) TaxID=312017 RepID=Q23JC7_TETTS|nr:cell surface immobilization antigen [Tetrahymena thermophila SB210]EAR96577.1 cell surface immobilization antigen [Tetrahymena thermophila SB210]|eukprot:XP_001016822.1 cell surface immobilization antigen [Tetrahymena thermophila SB210]